MRKSSWSQKNLRQYVKHMTKSLRCKMKTGELLRSNSTFFSRNIHLLRDCTQFLFLRQQLNFNYDSVASLLHFAYKNIITYRSALYVFRLNLMTAITTLLRNQLPMSLQTKDSLFRILEVVVQERAMSEDWISLAIPLNDIFLTTRPNF